MSVETVTGGVLELPAEERRDRHKLDWATGNQRHGLFLLLEAIIGSRAALA